MLQRIQTVFLILTIVCMVIAIFFPIWVGEDAGLVLKLFPLHYTEIGEAGMKTIYFPYSITAILMTAAATIAFMEVRRYDNRILQIKLGTLNSLILMGVMISAVLFANQLTNEHPTGWTYGPGLYIPFAGVTFNWLAVRFIRRDEKLVRDADRIR
jgi:glucan phosphoethanolaminetransferase (alkaline phosphatase superfamily)